jgi:hypothetical protein
MATEAITGWGDAGRSEPSLRERWQRTRGRRVAILVIGIAVLSLADLVITLTYLRSTGMFEGNPIARWVMSHGSSGLLVVWKLGSISLTCLVFGRFRTRVSTELASWMCLAILAWLLLEWRDYADEVGKIMASIQRSGHNVEAHQFVRIEE